MGMGMVGPLVLSSLALDERVESLMIPLDGMERNGQTKRH
jgi:hypothetical protein